MEVWAVRVQVWALAAVSVLVGLWAKDLAEVDWGPALLAQAVLGARGDPELERCPRQPL